MSTLWHLSELVWVRTPLDDSQPFCGSQVGANGLRLVPFLQDGVHGMALLLERGATAVVNGDAIHDLALLGDRDEILVGARRFYFSNESLSTVTAFQLEAGKRRPNCGVCRGPIQDGDLVVLCPRCGRTFHQSEGREHWTYRAACPFDGHPTSLTGESSWSPAAEDGDVD